MSWFQRQVGGRRPEQVREEHARYVRASGLDRALQALSGPFGLRRFMVFFERRGGGVKVTDIHALLLGWGGGPPPEDPTGDAISLVERALTQLHRNMALGPAWTRGAVGFVRDVEGKWTLVPHFDEDADQAAVEGLPVPGPPGHPLEGGEYLHLRAKWEPALMRLHARSSALAHDWDEWSVEDDRRLVLQYDGPPAETRRMDCQTLATFEPRSDRFTWRVEQPLFDEAVFHQNSFSASVDAAMEVALIAGARLDARSVLALTFGDHGGILFVAVF